MAVPHYNYYPPAGQVVDANDSRVQWNGRAWTLNGRNHSVPSSHRLIGKPGGPLAGWSYDWKKRAWMEPSAPAATSAPPVAPTVRPSPAPVVRPQPQPPALVPVVKESVVEKKKLSPIESLIKHPVAPVVGGVLVAAAYLTDEPQPPTLPDGLPEPTAKQWQMIYAQNQQRFQRRMDLYKDLGMVLLGYASAQTIIDALPARQSTTVLTPSVPTVAHRAM